MSLHPGSGSYNPAENSDFTRKAEALALGIAKALPNHWPTPAAQNWKGSSGGSITRTDGKSRMDLLHYRAEQGFTCPAPVTLPDGPTVFAARPDLAPALDLDDCLAWPPGCAQFLKYQGEDAHPGPASKPVLQGLVGTVDRGRILPSQPIPLDVDDTAQHLAVVGSRATSRLGKERLKPLHLLPAQPEISLVSFDHDHRESLNPLACNKNL